MVALDKIHHSNTLLATSLPSSPVAVFVGGTKGIGAHALRAFAKHTSTLAPRIYVVARSQAAGDAIVGECQKLCPTGTLRFIQADASLMREVDRVCGEIAQREKAINLLFMSQGTLDMHAQTSEGLGLLGALSYYSRIRFMMKLLPLLKLGKGLRRVVSVFTATKEGPFNVEDMDLRHVNLRSIMQVRGHGATMMTLGMESLSADAPEVGFVHNFPGFVQTSIGDTMPGLLGVVMRTIGHVSGLFLRIPGDEVGERHLFFATSARFGGSGEGIAMDGLQPAKGTDGKVKSGMYSVDEFGEPGKTEELLAGMRKDGTRTKIWEHTLKQFDRISNA